MQNQIAIAAPEITITFTPNMKMSERPVVLNARDCVELLRKFWDQNFMEVREESKMILLGSSSRVLGIFPLSVGGVSETIIDPLIVFLLAVRTPGTKSIILAHNHPSGSANPSKADLLLTENIKAGAALLGLRLLDHIIITSETFLSMAAEGII